MPNPWEMDWGQPQVPSGGGLEAVPLAKQPPAQTPAQAALDEINLELKRKELAKGPVGAALTAEDRGKFQRQRQGALGLKTRISEVEQLYADAFRGSGGDVVNPSTGERTITAPGLGSAAEYLPGKTPIIGRPINEVFKNAGGSLMGDLAAAYGLTAQQQNTPTELEIRFGPFIPKPGDPDDVIEAKIRRLKEVANEQERQALDALGIAREDSSLAGAPMPAQTVPALGDIPNAGERMTTAPGLVTDPGAGTLQSSTETKTVTDEQLAAIAPKIGAMVSRGLPAANIRMFMKKNGVDPAVLANLDEILRQRSDPKSSVAKWIKANQGRPYPINPQYEVPLEGFEKGAAETAAGPFGAWGGNAINAATAGNLANIASLVGGEEAANRALTVSQAEQPLASLGGTIAGGVGGTLGAEAALARLGMAPGIGRAILADTGYGAAVGGSNPDDGESLLRAALEGGGAALAGSLAGQGATRGAASLTGGVRSPSVRAVVAEDVPMTVGQSIGQSGPVGRFVKSVEDRLAGSGVDAGLINARRMEGIEAMNAKAFDKALEPIGAKVGGKFAEEGIAEAQALNRQAFSDALAGKAASVDRPFITQAAAAKNAIQKLPPRLASEVQGSIDQVVKDYFDPATLTISGENMQNLLEHFGRIKRAYAKDPQAYEIGKAIDMFENSVESMFLRQAPEVMPAYNAAKQAYKRVSILQDAVNAAKNTGGVFTPAQLGIADKANTIKYGGKAKAARGASEFHDFQRAMQDVLPNKIPDSGTAGRIATLAVPGALVGGGYAAGGESGATTGLTLAGLLAAAYSRAGQRGLTGLTAKRGPKAQASAEKIRKGARLIGGGVGTTAALETSRGQ